MEKAILTGSPKQIAWANDIRNKGISELEKYKKELNRRASYGDFHTDQLDKMITACNDILTRMHATTCAKIIIESRWQYANIASEMPKMFARFGI